MKSLVRLLFLTFSLLVAVIVTQDHDESGENLQKLKRAALRRNTGGSGGGKPQKVPKFGWGKRRADYFDMPLPIADSDRPTTKRHGYLEAPSNPWTSGPKITNLRRRLNEGGRKCEWYGCRVERSGWDSQYGKRSEQIAPFSRDRKMDEYDFEEEKRQVNRNGWNSAYGRRRREALEAELDEE